MQSRDYVYARQCKIDHRTKTMYLVSKATEHPGVPCNKHHVRVTTFESSLVIKPHRTFDEVSCSWRVLLLQCCDEDGMKD